MQRDITKPFFFLCLECLRLLNYTKEFVKNKSAFTIHLHRNHARELSGKNHENSDFQRFYKAWISDMQRDITKPFFFLCLECLRLLNYTKEFVKNKSAFTIHLHQNHARELSEGK